MKIPIHKRKPTVLQIFVGTLSIIAIFLLFNSSVSIGKEEMEYFEKIDHQYNVYSIPTPTEVAFAGEIVPMEDRDIYERLDREMHVNTYYHSNTFLSFKRANRWFPTIEKILKKNNIPEDFKYLALIESGFQNVVSPAGARGFWQFLESTGKEYGLEINDEVDERYHVEKSTEAACRYLNEAYERLGSWSLAAGSYNMGIAGIQSELLRQKATNYYDLLLNEETKRYLFRILAMKEIFEKPEQYGFNIRNSDLYPPLEYSIAEVDTAVADFADFSLDFGISYKTLKYFNPWLRQGYLKNPNKKTYRIKLPLSASKKEN